MLVLLERGVSEAVAGDIATRLRMFGLAVHRTEHEGQVRLGAVGDRDGADWDTVRRWTGVATVENLPAPFKLASRAFQPHDTVISVGRCAIGSSQLAIMAGPCSVEGERQAFTIAAAVAKAGATVMRGGAYKPRTSPYSFQGLGEEGLKLLRRAADAHGLAVVSEVMDGQQVGLVARYADILQVGARNMQNFSLLREVGHAEKPVLLKRGLAATIEEWLMSAEHILSHGNAQVILCERGIRTFETATRNTFDISAIPVVKKLSHLPIVADPSHGAGRRDMVAPMARAAVAAGADGLIIEVHNDPDRALSDGAQSMFPSQFDRLMAELRIIAPAIGRSICLEPVSRRGWAITPGVTTSSCSRCPGAVSRSRSRSPAPRINTRTSNSGMSPQALDNTIRRHRDREHDRPGGGPETVEMLLEPKNLARIGPHPLEDAIAIEEAVIIDADLGLFLRIELAADIDLEGHRSGASRRQPDVLGSAERW